MQRSVDLGKAMGTADLVRTELREALAACNEAALSPAKRDRARLLRHIALRINRMIDWIDTLEDEIGPFRSPRGGIDREPTVSAGDR